LSGYFFKEPFEKCPFFAKVQYAEKLFFKKHLVLNHDFNDLVQFALNKGLIQDSIRYHNRNFILNQIIEFCKVKKKWLRKC